MTSLTRYAVIPVLILCCLGLRVTAVSQTKPASKATTLGTISGRVTIKGKGAPGVLVGLRLTESFSESQPSLKASTDQDGNYRIVDVPAGNYQVGPFAPAFVVSDVNSRDSRTRGLVIAEGEAVEGFDFVLVPGGVITGRVTDAEGRPIIDARISLLPGDSNNQRGPLYSGSPLSLRTDDRGIYRMFGISAGRYKVAAGEVEAYGPPGGGGRRAYKQTFHPDTADLSKATVIEVKEGGETSNVDITVGFALPGFAASGRVVDGENGNPVPNIRFALGKIISERNTGGYSSPPSTSNSQGEFRLEGLVPGKYVVSIFPQPEFQLAGEPVVFEVIDQDVSGLIIKTAKGAGITGIVILEGTDDKAVLARLAQHRLGVFVHSEAIDLPTSRPVTLQPNGSFYAGGLRPGIGNFYLAGPDFNRAKGFALSRIERDGIVQTQGLEIKVNEQITGVRVVFTYGTGTIRGVVRFENGTLPPGAHVSVRLSKLGETSPNANRPPQVDSRGHFLIEGLPPGNYEVHAVTYIQGSRSKPPSASQQISVANGTATEVTLTLDLRPDSGPAPKP